MASESDSDENSRHLPDRRAKPTSAWGAFPPAGRRVQLRRAVEHARPYFVDRFSAMTFVSLLLLLLGCLLDAALTIYLIEAGGTEINPLMKRLLDKGILPFFLGKYLLTVGGLPLLLVFKNHYLLGTRLRIGHLIPAFVVAYAILLCYQVCLILHGC
jgi:hypothetical protein